MKYIYIYLTFLVAIFSGCSQKVAINYDTYKQLSKDELASYEENIKEFTAKEEQTHIDKQNEILEQTKKAFEAKVVEDNSLREQIVSSALKFLNRRDGGDCSGFVSLVNIKNDEPYFSGSELNRYYTGVRKSKAMYNLALDKDRIVNEPKMGDLVFFEDTIAGTKRKIGAKNITHVGIITKVDSDDTIHFIHHQNGKNIISQMNLKHPNSIKVDSKEVNSYLKRCGAKIAESQCLTSHLFSAFASPQVGIDSLSYNSK